MDPHPETAENLAGYFKIPGKVLFLRTYFIEPGGCGAIRREPENRLRQTGQIIMAAIRFGCMEWN